MILPQSFYNRSALKVAQDLLGCFLVRKISPLPKSLSRIPKFRDGKVGKIFKYKIVETEAYNGPNDLASHASQGRTERNNVMFGEGGIIYVYFTYGMHYMLNIVTGKKDYPAAVLIRAVEPIPRCHCEEEQSDDKAISANRKNVKSKNNIHSSFKDRFAEFAPRLDAELAMTNGPAKLTKTLKIDKTFNGLPIYKKTRGLWIERRDQEIKTSQIVKTARVGIDYAGKYKNKKWRFYIKGNEFVSRK